MGEIDDSSWDGRDRRQQDRWHVGKEIPIAFLLGLLLQTGGGIWWAASLSAKIDNAIARLDEFRAERYTREDARRDRELSMQRDAEHDRRLIELETSVRGVRR